MYKLHPPVLLIILLLAAACEKSQKTLPDSGLAVKFTTQYQPPAFEDTARIERMKAAFPVVDKIYKEYAAKNNFPGIAFGIVADGKLIYSSASGLANLQSKIPASIKTDFRIASMSKSFTALSILRLRDEGKLSLQDPVSKYIPDLASVTYLTLDSPPITIEHLLTMSAGFPEDNPWGDRQLADTDEDLLALIRSGISFSNAPGLNYEYSNLGFAMLGKIVTTVSGQPYQQYITENILKPLHMDHARWEFTEIPKGELALGYRWEDQQWKEEPLLHDGAYGAMGGLICSVEDFSKYMAFHLSAWPPDNEPESTILKRSSLREMHQLQKLGGFFPDNRDRSGKPCPAVSGYGYGLGWRKDCSGAVCVRHSGGLPGFGSEWRILPDYGIGIIALSNLTYAGLGLPDAKALDTLIYLAHLKPRTLPVSSILQERQKKIVEVLPSWPAEESGIFAENFFLDESRESRKKSAAKLFESAGKIIRVNPVVPENQMRGTFVIEGEKNDIKVFFTLTPEQKPLVQKLDLNLISKTNH